MISSRKKTVFFLTNSLEAGGAERVLSVVLPQLTKHYEVFLFLLKNDKFYELPNTVRVIPLVPGLKKSDLPMLAFLPWYHYRLRRYIAKYRPSKVISFLELANFLNLSLGRSGPEAIISFRTSLEAFDDKSLKKTVYRHLIPVLYPQARHVVVNSQENKENVSRQLNISPDKITVIHNPVDLKEVKKLSQENVSFLPKPKNEGKTFITVGRLQPGKNMNVLIELFATEKRKNDILLVVGEGPERDKLEKLIEKLRLEERVFLLGRQRNVYKYLSRADYFLFASAVEGFPNVLVEALACNLPVITSDFKTGAREFTDPSLPFDEKISYPHYGNNGVLLSLENFKKDFDQIDFEKLTTNRDVLKQFRLESVISKWRQLIERN